MKNTIVFALSSSVGLAEDICKELGLELGKCEVKHFADGEILVELGECNGKRDICNRYRYGCW